MKELTDKKKKRSKGKGKNGIDFNLETSKYLMQTLNL